MPGDPPGLCLGDPVGEELGVEEVPPGVKSDVALFPLFLLDSLLGQRPVEALSDSIVLHRHPGDREADRERLLGYRAGAR